MNKSKQLDLSRKRNEQLSRQLETIKTEWELDRMLHQNGYEHAKELISELEKIKTDWLQALEDIQKKREEYQQLIADVKALRKGMGSKKRKKRGGFYGGL